MSKSLSVTTQLIMEETKTVCITEVQRYLSLFQKLEEEIDMRENYAITQEALLTLVGFMATIFSIIGVLFSAQQQRS